MHTRQYVILSCCLIAAAMLTFSCKKGKTNTGTDNADSTQIVPLTFDSDSAMVHIEAQCQWGPRTPGSTAHDRCADYIAETFRRYGLSVAEQHVTLQGWDGKSFPCVNITASYKPEASDRIVICSHWDSRPWADNDPDSAKHREPVMAANDGASGVAVMMELARQLDKLNPSVGVDFVCFDMEDYGAPYWGTGKDDGTDWCLGSQYWAANLSQGYKPRYGILLDMVGGADTQFRYEYYSRQFAPDIVAQVWSCAISEEAKEVFRHEDGTAAMDDHIPMNRIAHIPTIDIIGETGNGFSSTWHTVSDTPANISRKHLKAVGQTLLQKLYEEKSER